MQEQADALQLGARILFVGLEDIHPPTKGGGQSLKKSSARPKRANPKNLRRRPTPSAPTPGPRAKAFKRVTAAEADEHAAITNSAARAMLFANQQLAYNAAPGHNGVYEQHAYLETLVQNSADSRKYIIATTNTPNIVIFNLGRQNSQRFDRPTSSSSFEINDMKRSPLTMIVAAILIIIFGLLLFVYQVRKSEVAVVTFSAKFATSRPNPAPACAGPGRLNKFTSSTSASRTGRQIRADQTARPEHPHAGRLCRLSN